MTGNRRRMTYSIIAVSIVIIVCVAWFWKHPLNATTEIEQSVKQQTNQSTVATVGVPVIHFPEPSYDFGTITQGDKVTHTFIVQNTGDKPLKLIKAKGS